MSDTDLQLLALYARHRAEDAFAEIIRRHLGLVYSAALRQVRSPQLAEEVAQSVFADLARKADKLNPDTILTAWLYQVTRRTAIDVVRREARRQLREQIAVEMNAMNATATDWTQIEPLLDEAMDALDETDRAAVLLRYFENKSLREVGQALGASEDAAQKRVSRAVERLREFFSKRGVTISASGLATIISANAVQAAPAALAVTISTTAAVAGTTLATSATATATNTLAMTTVQKTIAGAALAAAVGTGVYHVSHSSQLREQIQTLQQQRAPLEQQIEQFTDDLDRTKRQIAAVRDENERLKRDTLDLLRLRAEVARLRQEANSLAAEPSSRSEGSSDRLWQPNWVAVRPFDLSQFPDSPTTISRNLARDAGTGTPAALLETWIWAQRTSNAQGMLKTWAFPEGTTDEQKMERVREAQADQEYARQNPDRIGYAETSRLRDLFDFGDGYYLALIESKGLTTGTWVSHQILRRDGDQWKVTVGRPAK